MSNKRVNEQDEKLISVLLDGNEDEIRQALDELKYTGMESVIVDTFGKKYIDNVARNDDRWFDKFNAMNPEYKDAVAKLMTKKLIDKIEECKNDTTLNYFLQRSLKFYNGVGESEKKYMRAELLKWRISGNAEEKRHKVEQFKRTLNGLGVEKDDTIKAVSRVSYTKFSSLNKALDKYIDEAAYIVPEIEEYAELNEEKIKKSAYIKNIAEKAKNKEEALKKFGINKPFEWNNGALIDGCDSWWKTIGYDKENRIEHREEIRPLYKFISKDNIELTGAAIYKYDRFETDPHIMLSGNRVKDREISAEEYKNMLNERRAQIHNKNRSLVSR